jgi:hypothetical protein
MRLLGSGRCLEPHKSASEYLWQPGQHQYASFQQETAEGIPRINLNKKRILNERMNFERKNEMSVALSGRVMQ